jgi:hypothetical protein
VIPSAHIHGSPRWPARLRAARRAPAGRIATWSAALGVTQAALLVGAAHDRVEVVPALVGLGVALSLIAAIVVGTAWFVRFAIPMGARASAAVGALIVAAFYGAAVWMLARPGGAGLFAATLLAPALVAALRLPRGTFAVARASADLPAR